MQNILPQEASEKLSHDKNAILIDVRREEEWMDGIANIQSLELITLSPDTAEFAHNLQAAIKDKNQELLFICKSGGRSAVAAELATKLGYKNCYNVSGGFMEWTNSNLPSKAWSSK